MMTEALIEALAPHGVTIISGLAYGIDAIAHRAALKHGLPTIGILAHSLDRIYPHAHQSLAQQMLHNGALLSDFRSGTQPDKQNFPKRNRIVAGMAHATVVIETDVKGGSMITAELANGYNRDVFALPGRTTDAKSNGCNWLIQSNKAMLLQNADDILQSMGWAASPKKERKQQRELFIQLSPDETAVMEVLKEIPLLHIDELQYRCKLSSSHIAAALLNLELQGLVTALAGKQYGLVDG
jgi:DNA processing protein